MTGLFNGIKNEDVFFAALAALVLTAFFRGISKIYGAVFKRPVQFGFKARDINRIIQKCYALFPNEVVVFRGEIFKRGMTVRVTTNNKKIIEGKLIGLNSENIFCVLTNTFIAADILDNVTEMVILPEQ